ncbi:MAG: hypothetical protein IKC41_00405 [Clostridia bacterium]|nr:hypothetical protein [Clostridia bacterium]
MRNIIGLDIGTSSVKGILMTEDGTVKKTARGGFDYTKLENGGIEIAADDFIDVCFSTIRELAQAADGEVAGICAASASGNLVILDKKNKPVTPIFNWQDTRVTTEARDILGDMDLDAFYNKVGWPFDYKTFPLALACYVKKHEPEKIKNCGKVCMSTEYLYYKLTGKWGISTSAGTPFYFIDQITGKYIPEVLEKLGINETQVPPVMPCGSILGTVTEKAAADCGLSEAVQVVLGSFDHPSAARGAGIMNEGEMLLSCGTSWVGFFPVKQREKLVKAKTLIDPFLSEKGGCWAGMVSVPSVSEQIWTYVSKYIDDGKDAYKKLSEYAKKSTAGANGLVICPTKTPCDEEILKYPKEDIARAIMEGTVNLLKDKLNALSVVGIKTEKAIMVGGPSEDLMWISLISEICKIKAEPAFGVATGAVGAAILAGIGVGIYKDEKEANKLINGGKNNV